MANRRVLVKRRKAVRNIRKITRTMQLIATARFQAALRRATASRPYTQKLAELVTDLSGAVAGVEHLLLKPAPDARRAILVVLTSRRGFCGAYNANVLRMALAHARQQSAAGAAPEVYMVGRKGINYYRFLRQPMARQFADLSDTPRFSEIEPLANDLMEQFANGGVASVDVAYMRFLSAAQQRAMVLPLLPLSRTGVGDAAVASRRSRPEYDFSPSPQAILDELLPASVRVKLFQCFVESNVSEQIARMVAMKAATDSAGDMITLLTQRYNRARQTHITMELLDIVGGANALQ